jgi:hypothetical protein
MKPKTSDIRNCIKTYTSRRILNQHWYTRPIANAFKPLRLQRNLRHPILNRFKSQTLPTVNRKHFFTNNLCIESFCPQKRTSNAALRAARSPFWLLKPVSEHEHARLLPRMSWSWTVLLPSVTYGKPVTFITTVSLPFVTHSLTPSNDFHKNLPEIHPFFHMELNFETSSFIWIAGWQM